MFGRATITLSIGPHFLVGMIQSLPLCKYNIRLHFSYAFSELLVFLIQCLATRPLKATTKYVNKSVFVVDYIVTEHHSRSPYVIGRPYIFSCCFFFFFFFPRLISAVGDWMFTILWHMVWP